MRHAATAACLAALSLAGCAAMSGDGSGPLALSPQVKDAYDHYLSLPGPQAFAVSTDGAAWGAIYCRWGTCRGNDVNVALESCRRSGKACYVYDREGRVVWQGAEQPAPRLASAAPAVTRVAAAAPSRPDSATALPTAARGVLAAAVDYERKASDSVDPVQAQLNEQCRQAGNQHCGEHQVPKDRRQAFVRGVDPRVHALFNQTGLAPGATYESLCRLVDPSNGIVATVRGVITIPADAGHPVARGFTCHFPLDTTAPLGRWTVALLVNGTPMSVLHFDLVDHLGARPPAPARGLRQDV
jgi:hypothetical protein